MPLRDLTTRFISYNAWANARLVALLRTIDSGLLHRPTGSSFPTIDLTLQHILASQRYWHTLITTGVIPDFTQPIPVEDVHEIMDALILSSKQLVDDFANFDEGQLLTALQVSDSKQCLYEYMLQVVNHTTYHRGQIVSMCRTLGITDEIPVTDYDAYLWYLEQT